MRPIKFRGRDVVTKRFVYGFYCKCGDTGLPKILTFKKGFQGFFPVVVDPDTVAQLVGYDANSKEVYEGDTVAFFYEGDTLKGTRSEWTAVLVPDIVKNGIQDVRSVAFNRLTLKETKQ